MIIARPSVAEERWLSLAARYAAMRPSIEALHNSGGWKTTTLLGRVLGFLLGLLAAGMLGGVLSPFPATLLVAGIVLLLAAEWLVAQRRVFRSGVEEALYLCGAVAVVVQVLIWNSSGGNEWLGMALVAMAVLLAGWRLLNPLFTTLAAAGLSLSIAFIDANLFSGTMKSLAASVFCSALAIAALAAGARQWQRPAHDRMFDGLVMVMPWLAYVWMVAHTERASGAASYAALALAIVFLAANLVVGLRRRQHAPLIGALGNLLCVGHALYELLRWALHWKLIAAGVVMLAVAVLLDRRLRHKVAGITSRAIDEPAGLELAQLAAAANLAPAPGAAPQPGLQGQGGEFGGGGASGRF